MKFFEMRKRQRPILHKRIYFFFKVIIKGVIVFFHPKRLIVSRIINDMNTGEFLESLNVFGDEDIRSIAKDKQIRIRKLLIAATIRELLYRHRVLGDVACIYKTPMFQKTAQSKND